MVMFEKVDDETLEPEVTYMRQVFSPVHSIREIKSFLVKILKDDDIILDTPFMKHVIDDCLKDTFQSKNPCIETFMKYMETSVDYRTMDSIEKLAEGNELSFLCDETPFSYSSLNEAQRKALEYYALSFKKEIVLKPYKGMTSILIDIIDKKEINDRIKKEKKRLEKEGEKQINAEISELFAMEFLRFPDLVCR